MSILDIIVQRERALVMVDSMGRVPNEQRLRPASKMFYIAHANALIAGRGVSVFTAHVFLTLGALGEDLDGMRANMPGVLAASLALLQQNGAAMGLASDETDFHVVALCGWSQKAGRMMGWSWERYKGGDGSFEEAEIAPYCFGPWRWPDLDQRPAPGDRRAARRPGCRAVPARACRGSAIRRRRAVDLR